ncbi:MAG: tetratricopeptide repeat protein, partial [Pseudomonadota bacterium]
AGDTDNAITVAQRARPTTAQNSDLTQLVLGIDALKQRRGASKAAQHFNDQMTSQFNAMLATSLLAWTAYDESGLEAAEQVFESATSRDVLISGLQRVNLALISISEGAHTEALEILQDIRQSGVRLAVATEFEAHMLHLAGRTDEAVALLDDFGRNIGQNAAIEHLRNELETGTYSGLERPTVRQGAALSIYIPAAALAARTGDDLASVYFGLSLHLDPNLHVARTLWADALDKADRRAEAMATLETVPSSSVFYATARGQLAWALRREGLNEEALAVAQTALDASPDRNLKIQLGDLFRSLDRYTEAETIFTEIMEEDTARGVTDWRLLYARGAAREKLGYWTDAEADLLAALALAPEQPSLMNYLGYSWIDRGENLEEGFDLIQQAVDLRPNTGYIIDSLGWAYYRLGQYEEAVKHLERAVELEPGEAILNDHLGDAYWRVGRHLEATFQWTRALRLDPESAETDLLHAKLENGLDNAAATVAANNALQDGAVSP